MSNPEERLTFVRLEGFFDVDKVAQIQEFVGKLGTQSAILETHNLRDRYEHGRLLEILPTMDTPVITEGVLYDFSKHVPGVVDIVTANSRSKALFRALWGHYFNHHLHGDGICGCSLVGGVVVGPFNRHRYVEPTSLVTSFENNELDKLPLDPSKLVSRGTKGRKSLKESVCYPILPAYIKALTT